MGLALLIDTFHLASYLPDPARKFASDRDDCNFACVAGSQELHKAFGETLYAGICPAAYGGRDTLLVRNLLGLCRAALIMPV